MEQKYKHFYNRAAFGIYPETETAKMPKDFVSALKVLAQQKPIQVVSNAADDYRMNLQKAKGDPSEKKEMKEQVRQSLVLLNAAWISQMNDPSTVLREKMTFFWHDHFACRTKNPYLIQQQNNTIRQHALEKFSDLLMAISKDPAMLQFLNNQQNKKDSPNENFAREVMELFTLGRGQYTEEDVKNAARAFTGWAFNPQTGEFVFRQRVHDFAAKIFRGKSGNFSGEDIIAMILEDKQTARFITKKIWQFFVHAETLDQNIIQDLSENFYNSGYDISLLLGEIFNSKWFYNEAYRGNRIKSPVELIVGLMVHTDGKFNNPGNLLFLEKALNQVLYQPPNVGGWPSDKEWIDSSSLAFRMSLPTVLLRNSETEFEPKDDGDINNEANVLDKARKISFGVNWPKLTNIFTKDTSAKTIETIEDHLLAKPTSAANRKIVEDLAGNSTGDPDFIKKSFTAFMSLPDYQLS